MSTATYSEKIKNVLDTIGGMSVRELVELKEAFKAEFKVEAAAPVMMGGGGGGAAAAPAAAEKSTYDVILKDGGQNKIPVIKVIREITGLGLKEAKELVDGAPKVLKETCGKAEAEEISKKVSTAGGKVTLKGL